MVLRPSSPQFLWTLLSAYFNIKLHQDPTLPQKTNMSIQWIVTLLEFCLKSRYFLFQGKYYEQVYDAAMGFSISPLITNLFMEEFKVKTLSLAPSPLTYALGIWMILLSSRRQTHSKQLLQNTKTQDLHIQVTIDEPDKVGAPPFKKTSVSSGPSNTLITSIYRNPTHTD